jgi:tetratricopeptide (TPR) repeat protein
MYINTYGRWERGEILYLEEKMRHECSWWSRGTEYWPRDETVPALDEAVALGYETAEIFYVRAVAHAWLANYGLALRDVNLAIEKSENNAQLSDCLCGRAHIFVRTGAYAEAYKDLTKARTLSGPELNVWSFESVHSITKEILYRFGIAHEFHTLQQKDLGIYEQVLRLLTLAFGRAGRHIGVGVDEEFPEIARTLRTIVGSDIWHAAQSEDVFSFIVDF